jgi:hypothetical protein
VTTTETADHLIRRLSYYPGDTTRLLVAADAVDDIGMFNGIVLNGDSLRWAAENGRWPDSPGCWYGSDQYTGIPFDKEWSHWLPPCLTTGLVYRRTMYSAWWWFICRFTELRAEDRI